MESLKLHWLGHPLIELKGRSVKLETRKAAALLAFLSLNPGECQREVLATMFWQEGNQQKALANLRRTLSSLNSSLPGWIEADRESIALKRNGKLWVDVEAFQQSLSQIKKHNHQENETCEECFSVLDKTIELYRGDFLEGLNLGDSPGFDDWQFFQRDGLRQEFADVLQRLTSGRAERGQWDQAIFCARRWVALDRLHEPASRALMDLYARSGQRTAALHQYEELARLLKEQMGQEPEEETSRLYDQIRGWEEAEPGAESSGQPTSFPLLKTKLYIPSAPVSRVERSHLIARLSDVEKKALTVISAPAGFGKTTLLAEWIAQTSMPVAWLSLDNGDNDPYRFLSYLISALESIHESIGVEARQIMQSPQLVPPHIVLASLMNDLGKVAEPYVLVLDDYQFITEHAVHETMAYLLDHVPSTLHLLISTRADPPLQLGRLRAHDQMLELRTSDLRFTPEEATEFLNAVMRLGLSVEDIETLETRTEGWVVGLKMAALSLKGHENASEFIHAFSGSHRYVLDYLVEEVLKRQPAHIQTFLLETSILEKLSGPLCDALMTDEWRKTGESGQAVLEHLEKSNLFVIPLDENKQWYRYHHLFADLLEARLCRETPQQANELYRRASLWMESNQLFPEAINYALAAKDYEHVAKLVELGAPAIWTGGGQVTLSSIISSIPSDLILKHPWLSIWQALLLCVSGKSSQALFLLQAAEEKLNQAPSEENQRSIRGHLANVRGNIALVTGDMAQAFKQAEIILSYQTPSDHVMMIRAYIILFHYFYWTGDLIKAERTLTSGINIARASGNQYWTVLLWSYQSRLLRTKGQLKKAIKISESVVDHASGKSTVYQAASNIHIAYADLLIDVHLLNDAEEQIRTSLKISQGWTSMVAITFSRLGLIRLELCKNNLAGAREALLITEQMVQDYEIDFELQAWLSSLSIRLLLLEGNKIAVAEWLNGRVPLTSDWPRIPLEIIQIARARAMIALELFSNAEELLAAVRGEAESGGRIGRMVEVLTLETLNYMAQGKTEHAFQALEKSLVLAEAEEYLSVFLDEGKTMQSLIKEVLVRMEKKSGTAALEKLKAFILRLLAAFDG